MELLIDRDIVGAERAFAGFGDVRLCDGRTLDATALGRAEVLLVRSVTAVDESLLHGSRVRFVGTATAGIDHVDTDFLAAAGIVFAAAAGCNARAVAEHVIACLYRHAATRAVAVTALRVAIVGYGHVGRALGQLLRRLGVPFVANDPPLGAALDGAPGVSLEEALGCDVVTVHVPLTTRGAHPTHDLIDRRALARMAPDALLINAARGGVVNEAALLQRLRDAPDFRAALDCWEGEPCIEPALLARSWLATPHIAGHTLEARVRAAADLHAALAAWTGQQPALPALLEPNPAGALDCASGGVAAVIEAGHDLGAHTARMQALEDLPAPARGAAFDALRRRHGLRRQFASYRVASSAVDADTVRQLQALDFDLTGAAPTGATGCGPRAQASPESRL